MRYRLGPGVVLGLAVLQATAPTLGQTLDDPRALLGEYASIAQQYRDGDPAAQSRLLALGPQRLQTLLALIGQAEERRPELLARETSPWTPALLRAAALLHTELALPAHELGDTGTFQRHIDAADRLLALAQRRETDSDFRPRWHVAIGFQLLAASDFTGARDFLIHSCEVLPAWAKVRLACGMAIALYASRLKVATWGPPIQRADELLAWDSPASRLSAGWRRLTREWSGLLDDAEGHLKAALAADPALDEGRLRLAYIHIERGRDPEADALLAPLMALKRPAPLAYLARLMLGGIRERQGLADAAAALYREASALLPEAPRAGFALANLLHAAGDRAASRRIVERLVVQRLNPPEDPWTFYSIRFIGTPYATVEDLRSEVRK